MSADEKTLSELNEQLWYAIGPGHTGAEVLGLIKGGANPNYRGREGRTPLHRASGGNYLEILELLIAAGGAIDATDDDGRTPLHVAAESGHHAIVEALTSLGADIESISNYGTPLDLAAWGGHVAVIALLLDLGANVNAKRRLGRTALHEAAIHGGAEAASLLLRRGADVDPVDQIGNDRTPLHEALGRPDIVQVLISYGADIEHRNNWGATPLHMAARLGATDVIELLLRAGANMNARDRDGMTARDYARQKNHNKVIALLDKVAQRAASVAPKDPASHVAQTTWQCAWDDMMVEGNYCPICGHARHESDARRTSEKANPALPLINGVEIERLRNWLVSPLSKDEADLVNRGKQYWAITSLSQDLQTDAKAELDGLRTIVRGPAQDGLLDARGMVFLLFTGVGADPYGLGLEHGAEYMRVEEQSGDFSPSRIRMMLDRNPINHRFGLELTDELRLLSVQAATLAPEVPKAAYRSLYVAIQELQKEIPGQTTEVIWQTWSEVFQVFVRAKGFAQRVALISYLLIFSIFDDKELSGFKMVPG